MTQVKELDRDGTFRAIPVRWRPRDSSKSQSVAAEIEYQIHSWYDFDKEEWNEWPGWREFGIVGYTYFIGKDGQPSESGCDQLSSSLGWDGRVATFATQQPPQCLVQISVKTESWEGKSSRKVKWLSPGDSDPRAGQGLAAEDVNDIDSSVGSLLRAAASSKRRDPTPLPGAAPAAPPPAKTAAPAKEPAVDYGNIPFAILLALPFLSFAF